MNATSLAAYLWATSPNGARLPYNARQYSIVKDLDCLNNRQNIPVLRIADFIGVWWAQVESNHRPHPYQGCALAI